MPSVHPPTCLETTGNDWTLVVGTRHKDAILGDYEAKYKTGNDHVVTKLKGKQYSDDVIHMSKRRQVLSG